TLTPLYAGLDLQAGLAYVRPLRGLILERPYARRT
ncbi:MAG: hypothetical protein RL145_2230, partial [Pseudomonadota bacterium]